MPLEAFLQVRYFYRCIVVIFSVILSSGVLVALSMTLVLFMLTDVLSDFLRRWDGSVADPNTARNPPSGLLRAFSSAYCGC